MRSVRPGEVPTPLSIWRWRDIGSHYLVLGIERWPDHMYHLRGVNLHTVRVQRDCGIWTTKALVGMGRVLDEWVCVEEAPDVNTI